MVFSLRYNTDYIPLQYENIDAEQVNGFWGIDTSNIFDQLKEYGASRPRRARAHSPAASNPPRLAQRRRRSTGIVLTA